MDSNKSKTGAEQEAVRATTEPASSNVLDVDVEPLGEEDDGYPVIPPERRLSWLGWTAALAVFMINKKAGIVFFILLLVFGKFPTLNLKNLPGSAGRLFRKMRS